jgi:hypothetical protein
MLLLMKDGCYLVDRKFAVRRVTMRFPAPLKTHGVTVHHATLLDGEMVVDGMAPGKQRQVMRLRTIVHLYISPRFQGGGDELGCGEDELKN